MKLKKPSIQQNNKLKTKAWILIVIVNSEETSPSGLNIGLALRGRLGKLRSDAIKKIHHLVSNLLIAYF